jgi:FAD/FMN-containing dehydrogenase
LRRARLVDGRGVVHEVAGGTDLMWALRGGGGGGLGVVTELEFDSVACPKGIWSYRFKALQLKPAQLVEKTRAWFDAAAALPRHAFSAHVLSGNTLTLLVTSTAPTPDTRLKKALREMAAFTDKAFPGQYSPLPEGTRRYYGKLSPLPFRNASAGYYRQFRDIESALVEIAQLAASHTGLLYQINTLGGAIDDPVAENHSVYAHRGYPFLGEIQSYWEDPALAAPLIAAVARVQALLRQAGVSRHYANYADGDLKQWDKSYYGVAGYQKLQAIKQRLDPDNVFRHPQSIALP